VYRFSRLRPRDGQRVAAKITIGSLSDFPTESAAWAEVNRLGLEAQINVPYSGRITFADLANMYVTSELPRLAFTTQAQQCNNFNRHLLPRWGRYVVAEIRPLEVQQWLDALVKQLATPTRAKLRDLMHRVLQFGLLYELIPAANGNPIDRVNCRRPRGEVKPKPIILTPHQAWQLVQEFPPLPRALTLLAAITGLRISECLGLRWSDFDWSGEKVQVQRTFLQGKIGEPKSEASRHAIPMDDYLAQLLHGWRKETLYARDEDWIFASDRLKGRKPRTGGILAQDYLRPAAIKLGILPPDYHGRFGFHNLRHSLGTFLASKNVDMKSVQGLLRHSKAQTTFNLYIHEVDENKRAAQKLVTQEMRSPTSGAVH
jgi:integrase